MWIRKLGPSDSHAVEDPPELQAGDGQVLVDIKAVINSIACTDDIRQAGAHHVIDLLEPDQCNSLRNQLLKATGGKGTYIVINTLDGEVIDASPAMLLSGSS